MRRGTYFENPGMPTDEERGTYCPDGEKIAEFPPGQPERMRIVEPWPCDRPGCTRKEFERARAEMEADLVEADRQARGCLSSPGRKEPCEGDRGLL